MVRLQSNLNWMANSRRNFAIAFRLDRTTTNRHFLIIHFIAFHNLNMFMLCFCMLFDYIANSRLETCKATYFHIHFSVCNFQQQQQQNGIN